MLLIVFIVDLWNVKYHIIYHHISYHIISKVHNREESKHLLRTARNRRILHMPKERIISYSKLNMQVSSIMNKAQKRNGRICYVVPWIKSLKLSVYIASEPLCKNSTYHTVRCLSKAKQFGKLFWLMNQNEFFYDTVHKETSDV